MIFKKNNKNKLGASGFTLVEVMAAVMVLSIGLIGSLTLINSNLRNIYSEENRIFAAGLVEDGMERVRNMRDTNWLQGRKENNGGEEDRWDYKIDGNDAGGPNNREFIKIFCGNGVLDYLTQGDKPSPSGLGPHSENEYIDDCASNNGAGKGCKIFVYTKTNSSAKCYGDDFANFSNPYGGYSGVHYSGFYRMIHIHEENNYSNKVSVTVRWTENGQNKYLTAEEILYNWQN